MIDIQSQKDEREIPLEKVGIKGLKYPLTVLDKEHKTQNTTVEADLYVNLPVHFKGTHMSRFIEVFHKHHQKLSMPHFLEMLEEIRVSLQAAKAFAKLTFPYFLEKPAPVSGQRAVMSYICTYEGSVEKNGSDIKKTFMVSVEVPVQTVCPCSKAISARGAHNQRGRVKVTVQCGPFFWIEDLIDKVEKAASLGLYSLLKREDEKYVTEKAYDNPKFVEDIVRDVYLGIKELGDFPFFSVEAENFESIHNHNAFAYTEFKKQE